MDDLKLIQSAQKGDWRSFEELIKKYEQNIFNLSLLLTHNQAESEELAQQIFIKLWRKIKKFNFRSSFSTWIYRLSYNTFYDYLRKKRKRIAEVPLDELPFLATPDNPHEELKEKEKREIIKKALEKLPERYRLTLLLYDFENLSYEEIAKVMKKSVGTVKSRLFRARELLRKELRNFFSKPSV